MLGTTPAGDEIPATATCPACSEGQGGPVYFGERLDGSPIQLVVAPETTAGQESLRRLRRHLPRTIAVGLMGLSVIAFLATVYSWFSSSIWGGIAFFALFAAVAIAYKSDDAAALRRGPQGPAS